MDLTDIDATLNWVRRREIPLRQIVMRAGLSGRALRHIDRDDWDPRISTVRKLCAVRREVEQETSKDRVAA